MQELNEHHAEISVSSAELIPLIVRDDVLQDFVDAIIVGAGKHQLEIDSSKSLEYYRGAFRRHWAALQGGEIYDKKDGHKHVGALFVRLCQIAAKLNEENMPNVQGFGVA